MDLSVITAVLSSDLDIAIAHDVCFAGEVGLTGEIRPVSRVEQRIAEAEKIGFKKIIISSAHKKNIENIRHTIDITTVSKIEEVFRLLFVRRKTVQE